MGNRDDKHREFKGMYEKALECDGWGDVSPHATHRLFLPPSFFFIFSLVSFLPSPFALSRPSSSYIRIAHQHYRHHQQQPAC
jgi:hypothetical protein